MAFSFVFAPFQYSTYTTCPFIRTCKETKTMTTFYVACDEEGTIQGAFLHEQPANVFPRVETVEEDISGEQERLYYLEYGEEPTTVRLFETRKALTKYLMDMGFLRDGFIDNYDGIRVKWSEVKDDDFERSVLYGPTGDRIALIPVIH